jgi:lipopolysaccharide export system protein LptA
VKPVETSLDCSTATKRRKDASADASNEIKRRAYLTGDVAVTVRVPTIDSHGVDIDSNKYEGNKERGDDADGEHFIKKVGR